MTSDRERQLSKAIGQIPRVELGVRPTPLHFLPRFSEMVGGPPIYMKRDDLTGLAFGGNKTRMLEFGLADGVSRNAEVIVFGAAVQSNYCRQMAAACAKLGLDLHLILRPERDIDRHDVQGNHLLQRLFGAKVTILEDNDRQKQQQAIRAEYDLLISGGKRAYIPRLQDTVDLDAIAYAEAALEIAQQCRQEGISPRTLYVAALDTTQAGLVLGLNYIKSPIWVKGISPFQGMPDRMRSMATMANRAADRLQLDLELAEEDFDNDDTHVGERYGIPTEAGLEALYVVARTEGILLDPVYTSKAMAALIQHIRDGRIEKDAPVLFVHTGGAPALFGYVQEVLGAEAG